MILVSKTGHWSHYNSNPTKSSQPVGSFDGCKTCDSNSKRCQTCKDNFTVCGVDGIFYSLQSAKIAEDNYNKRMASIIPTWGPDCCDARFYIDKCKLYATVLEISGKIWKIACVITDGPDSEKLYQEVYENTLNYIDKFNKCTCSDKNESDGCDKLYGCRNAKCFYNMTHNFNQLHQPKDENSCSPYKFN